MSHICNKCSNHPAIVYVEDLDLGELYDPHLCINCVREHSVEIICHLNEQFTERFGEIIEEVLDWDVWDKRQLVSIDGSLVTMNGILLDRGWVNHGDGEWECCDCEEEPIALKDLVWGTEFDLIHPDTLASFNTLLKEIKTCGFVIDESAKMGEKVKQEKEKTK